MEAFTNLRMEGEHFRTEDDVTWLDVTSSLVVTGSRLPHQMSDQPSDEFGSYVYTRDEEECRPPNACRSRGYFLRDVHRPYMLVSFCPAFGVINSTANCTFTERRERIEWVKALTEVHTRSKGTRSTKDNIKNASFPVRETAVSGPNIITLLELMFQ